MHARNHIKIEETNRFWSIRGAGAYVNGKWTYIEDKDAINKLIKAKQQCQKNTIIPTATVQSSEHKLL